ncbi:hypothetical protein [Desulfobaculum bizertense]|uniref:Uncharacterized protein n=1 Tax=Desulfobaculum bizertense DSM 18034 TaxID=1121442 RepID=A0A1T4W7Q3_9BACT|nr:hypothetical protein [Desulfobaculum bizertense]UIJ39103.1 hypothetical protein LWC08_05905 [Desulfobaculum bizertense]SKA73068.1 hypothetical protein SAMN02745702_01784 [Desulfobaculum bizertense DSM 18034]
MRIGGYGSGFSGGNPSGSPEYNRRVFRSRFRVGENIHGRLRYYIRPELALITVEGIELTAQITSLPAPQPGNLVCFRILQLTPEIILQEKGISHAPASALETALASFHHTRGLFEKAARPILFSPKLSQCPPAKRHTFFMNEIDAAPELPELWKTVWASCATLRQELKTVGPWEMAYRPWQFPGMTESECVQDAQYSSGLRGEAALSALHPDCGKLEIRNYLLDPHAQCQPAMEHPAERPDITALASLFLPHPNHTIFLAAVPLPPSSQHGSIARIIQKAPSGHLRLTV